MGRTKPSVNYYRVDAPLYIALEDVKDTEFIWSEQEVARFEKLWNIDMPIKDIADRFGRSISSVFLLAFDRVMKGEIKGRKGWKIW